MATASPGSSLLKAAPTLEDGIERPSLLLSRKSMEREEGEVICYRKIRPRRPKQADQSEATYALTTSHTILDMSHAVGEKRYDLQGHQSVLFTAQSFQPNGTAFMLDFSYLSNPGILIFLNAHTCWWSQFTCIHI